MRKHILNMFQITNLNELDFSFRLVEFDSEPLKFREEIYHQNLNKLSQKVSFDIHGPSAVYHFQGKPYIAIPANHRTKSTKIDLGPLSIPIKTQEEQYQVAFNDLSNQNLDLVQKFLEFSIRSHLSKRSDLWRLNANQYFRRLPVNHKEDGNIDVFGGFNFKVINRDKAFFIVLDLNYKYLDRHQLSEYVNKSNLNSVGTNYRGRRCLYLNGDNWYTVEIVGFGDNIGKQEYNGVPIIDYIKDKTKNSTNKVDHLLKPDTVTMLYKYPGRAMEPHSAAACLAKLIYKNDHPDIKGLHNKSALEPNRRFKIIKSNINNYFSNLSFGNHQLEISDNPLTSKSQSFLIPSLSFNNNNTLSLGGNDENAISIRDYGIERKKHILEHGILNQEHFDPQFLILPKEMDRQKSKQFQKDLEDQLKSLSQQFRGFHKVVAFKTLKHKSATHQVNEIKRALDANQVSSGFALFVLPNYGREYEFKVKNLHDCIKNKFYPDIKFQCASQFRIESYYKTYSSNAQGLVCTTPEHLRRKFKSYLFNLGLELLLVNRKWPYSLSRSLNYDIYVGIDVHDRYVGFTFFYKNGEKLFFDSKRVPKKTGFKRAEKIRAKDISEKLIEKLEHHIPKYCPNPNGIVMIRDGRSFSEEEKALKKVIKILEEKSLVNSNEMKWAVVDLHKQSAVPLRMASESNGYEKLENPRSGSYFNLSAKEGFIFSTGFPFKIPGSVKPLYLSMIAGNADFNKILMDVYNQCMLAYSAPDRSNSLPITIKLIDNLIQPLANSYEETDEEVQVIEENY